MVINIICLHIESLRIAIRTEHALLSEENVRVFLSEVKILLLTEVINYQNTMFTKISDNTWHSPPVFRMRLLRSMLLTAR